MAEWVGGLLYTRRVGQKNGRVPSLQPHALTSGPLRCLPCTAPPYCLLVLLQFRNEGIDLTHNPEFTTCEFYQVGVVVVCDCGDVLHGMQAIGRVSRLTPLCHQICNPSVLHPI